METNDSGVQWLGGPQQNKSWHDAGNHEKPLQVNLWWWEFLPRLVQSMSMVWTGVLAWGLLVLKRLKKDIFTLNPHENSDAGHPADMKAILSGPPFVGPSALLSTHGRCCWDAQQCGQPSALPPINDVYSAQGTDDHTLLLEAQRQWPVHSKCTCTRKTLKINAFIFKTH